MFVLGQMAELAGINLYYEKEVWHKFFIQATRQIQRISNIGLKKGLAGGQRKQSRENIIARFIYPKSRLFCERNGPSFPYEASLECSAAPSCRHPPSIFSEPSR
ncbi:hypothetical protein Zmor_002434 [Zophobas morio]|uniref:Uncharacterized protein n=1 Tax=Zophobas morio TaxID=2755281 RepID=A0AA38J6F8_9CUCU|nr:hypothetical protein Zmor_002434 [Zophobas morio]